VFCSDCGRQRGIPKLRGDETEHQRQVFLQALRAYFQTLRADRIGDLRAHAVQFFRDRELVERLGTTVEHHPGERRDRDVAGLRHGIARGQSAQDRDHVAHAGAVGDEIDAGDLRAVAVVDHQPVSAGGREHERRRPRLAVNAPADQMNALHGHDPFSAVPEAGTNQPVVL
jgi:hypothetical protein